MEGDIDDIIESGKLLLPMLTEIQDREGYVSEDAMRKIHRKLGIPMSKIYGVVTFYSFLKAEKEGRNVIHICNSPSCYLNGSMDLIKAVEAELGIKSGQTTEDGMFTLHIGSCIGCCDNAPAMLVNDKEFMNLTEYEVKEIIRRCRS